MKKSITMSQLKKLLRESDEVAVATDTPPAAPVEPPAAPADPAAAPAVDPAVVEAIKQLAALVGLQVVEPVAEPAPAEPAPDAAAQAVAERRARIEERRKRLAERRAKKA